jgi:hypothetical protein
MKLVLTDAKTSREVVVDSDRIALFEPSVDPANVGGSHIVIDENMGREVEESPSAIAAVVGAFIVNPTPKAALAADVAKGKKR